ncbi:hypothetical protein OESDEN_09580 [Oesophagostomum dentatum]|uniref:Uncharacterized protein n=1 Tax=Oesophagostomum dentatum TaxID=61180 RepID=A0A0B1T353_OESDE|nr:hypothetical protein OESDEN_09580 [Oesophagostomum dentatum]
MGAAADLRDPQYNITPIAQKILGVGLLLVGEYPFVSHTVKELLFDGYNDPLLTIGHSKLMSFLSGVLNGGKSIIPIPIPPMPLLGFFQGKDDKLPFFQSFMCRSFTKTFLGETVVHGIPSYTFVIQFSSLPCYQGRLQDTPFSVMYSPPHFAYSPPQMVNSVVGINPDNATHLPMVFNHEPVGEWRLMAAAAAVPRGTVNRVNFLDPLLIFSSGVLAC